MSETSKIDSLIGLARRAGRLAVGTMATEIAIKKGRAYLVILSTDLAFNSRDALEHLCRRHDVPWIDYGNRGQLGHAIGRDERAVLAVTSREFAAAIRRLARPEE